MYIGKRKEQVKKSVDEYVYREKNGLDKKSSTYYVYRGKRKE